MTFVDLVRRPQFRQKMLPVQAKFLNDNCMVLAEPWCHCYIVTDRVLSCTVPGEVKEDGTVAQKIYDTNITCTPAREYFEKICQQSCDLVLTRSLWFAIHRLIQLRSAFCFFTKQAIICSLILAEVTLNVITFIISILLEAHIFLRSHQRIAVSLSNFTPPVVGIFSVWPSLSIFLSLSLSFPRSSLAEFKQHTMQNKNIIMQKRQRSL